METVPLFERMFLRRQSSFKAFPRFRNQSVQSLELRSDEIDYKLSTDGGGAWLVQLA